MVISAESDNRAQLHTLEGFAAAMLMVGTVYLVVSAVTLSVPQTVLYMDAQLKAYGQDALNILDTSLPPENNRSYYSSVLKNSVVSWMNGVEGATSFETDEFEYPSFTQHTSYKFEFKEPFGCNDYHTFEVLIPNNTRISHAYVTLTGMPRLNDSCSDMPLELSDTPLVNISFPDHFGCAITHGDVNDDGVSDMIVGAYNSSSGAVYVYYGNNSSIGTWEDDGPNITILNPGASGDQFGWAVACGDVNGDDVDDIIVGAPENGTTDTGAVYVYYGGATPSNQPNATLFNPICTGNSGGRFGHSIACGDLNDDNKTDLLVGAPTMPNSGGGAFIYYGAISGVYSGSSWNVRLYANDSNEFFGISVACFDIDGDDVSDIIIGANATNRTYIRYGSTSLPSPINANNEMNLTLYGESDSDFGISVSDAGDVNKDGICDLIVGASANDSAHIFYGGFHPDNMSDINLTGESGFGISVSYAGDVDSDGYAGVIVGRSDSKAEVFYDVDLGVDQIEISGDAGFGSVVSYIGDVDNDGIHDVAVGAPGAGKVYVYTPKFPEEPWLAVGNTTDLDNGNGTKVWEYTTVIKTDDSNCTDGDTPPHNLPVHAGNSTDKTLPIYREITTDALLSTYVKTDSGKSANLTISVNGVEVNASRPAIDTSGNWTWHNITLPWDITEWRIGDNTITINVTPTSDTLTIGRDTGGANMIRVIPPITQPFQTTERTPDFADAINRWTANHPLGNASNVSEKPDWQWIDTSTNETGRAVPFILHSNSSGAIDATNLHVKAAPSLDEYLDMLLPDFVNYNVIFAFLDTLTKGHLYTFSDGSYEKTLNFTNDVINTEDGNLTVHILLPENTTEVYKANMDVTGLPNESTGTVELTRNFAQDADAAIVVDSEGNVHIGYSKNNPQLWYIGNEDGAWVEDDINKGGKYTSNLSMTIDSSDELHAAFIKKDTVYYSRTNDGIWLDKKDMQVVNDSVNPPPSQPYIAVDTANAPHIVWVENASIYYSNNTAGIWSPAVQVNNTNATSPLLNIDSNNTKHLVFLANRTVYYMNTTGGNWSVPIRVDNSTNVSHVARSSDHNGYLYLAWAENGTTLYYSNNTAGFWSQKEPIYNGTSVSDPSIGTDYYSGISHIVWADDGEIYYSNNADGSWSSSQHLGSGYEPYIAEDAGGNIHVIWGEDNVLYYYGYVLNYPTKPYIVIHNSTVWNYDIEDVNHNDVMIGSIALGDSGTDAIYKEFDIDTTVEGKSYLSIYTKGNNGSIDIYVNDRWVRSAFIPANSSFVWHNITLPPGVWDRGINELHINGSSINNTYGYANSTNGVNDWYCDNGSMQSLDYTWMIRLYATEYRGTQTTADFSETLTSYISSHNASGGNYNITSIVHSDTEGKIKLSRLRVYYYIRGNETQVVQKRIITNGIPQYNSVTATRLVTIQYTDIPNSTEARNYAETRIPDASMAPAPIIDLWNIVEVRLELWYK
ncbi:MAG: hypothetical protein U9O53_00015 [archaeon]|nr:hypothetical protein [archaeon]